MEQMNGLADDIEVVVSDNCSTDETEDIVRWAQQFGQIRYNRNKTNIGAGPNFNLLIEKLAQGEYCWIIGDDDFLRKNSLFRLIKGMKENPEVDLFHINGMHIDVSQVYNMTDPVSSEQFPNDLITSNNDFYDRELASFNDLIDPSINRDFLCGIMCSIFRRKKWMDHSHSVKISEDNFRDAFTTYPHAVILTMSMRGSRIFRFGNPIIVIGDGNRNWESDYPMVAHVRSLELLEIFENLGVDTNQIEKCRRYHLINNVPSLIFTSIRMGGHLKNYVDYNQTLLKYVAYKEFWLSIPYIFYRRILKIIN